MIAMWFHPSFPYFQPRQYAWSSSEAPNEPKALRFLPPAAAAATPPPPSPPREEEKDAMLIRCGWACCPCVTPIAASPTATDEAAPHSVNTPSMSKEVGTLDATPPPTPCRTPPEEEDRCPWPTASASAGLAAFPESTLSRTIFQRTSRLLSLMPAATEEEEAGPTPAGISAADGFMLARLAGVGITVVVVVPADGFSVQETCCGPCCCSASAAALVEVFWIC
mmetsp:Transcript_6845/g.20415  ORF Transcript_6845/g.20415 Transcript_6845/m.20415 type:complete len:223 (-) Transcript_6845:1454-2122(-)